MKKHIVLEGGGIDHFGGGGGGVGTLGGEGGASPCPLLR